MEAAPRYTLLTLLVLFILLYCLHYLYYSNCLNSRVYAFEYCLERLEGELE